MNGRIAVEYGPVKETSFLIVEKLRRTMEPVEKYNGKHKINYTIKLYECYSDFSLGLMDQTPYKTKIEYTLWY